MLRAAWIANTAPMGPVYINFDAELQEAKLAEPLPPIDPARFMPQAERRPRRLSWSKQAADVLKGAQEPAHPGRPRLAQRGALERARGARRERSMPASSPI